MSAPTSNDFTNLKDDFIKLEEKVDLLSRKNTENLTKINTLEIYIEESLKERDQIFDTTIDRLIEDVDSNIKNINHLIEIINRPEGLHPGTVTTYIQTLHERAAADASNNHYEEEDIKEDRGPLTGGRTSRRKFAKKSRKKRSRRKFAKKSRKKRSRRKFAKKRRSIKH
tara:strand:- start:870 stop:1376 length:507 start_codon:yes stop_codon:yes gene_type:complete